MKCRDFHTEQISAEQYHARPEISHSGAKCFSAAGAWEFYHRHIAKLESLVDEDEKESTALRLGRAFHSAMEGVESWRDRYAEEPLFVTIGGSREPINRRKPSHREALKEWETEQSLAGRTIIPAGGFDQIRCMTESVLANPAAMELVSQDKREHELAGFGVDLATGISVRALADILLPEFNPGGGARRTIVDFKSTKDTNPAHWCRRAMESWGLGYDKQAAWYSDLFGAELFVFIVVRSTPPWESWVLSATKDVLDGGRALNARTLSQIAEIINQNWDWQSNADCWHCHGFGEIYPMTNRGDHHENV